jgi:hypothetical protein
MSFEIFCVLFKMPLGTETSGHPGLVGAAYHRVYVPTKRVETCSVSETEAKIHLAKVCPANSRRHVSMSTSAIPAVKVSTKSLSWWHHGFTGPA